MGHLMDQKEGKPQNGQKLVTEKHHKPHITAETEELLNIIYNGV